MEQAFVSARVAVVALAALGLSASAALAQRPAPAPKGYRLQLKEYPKLPKGKYVFVEGTATPAGDHFFLENLAILQPVRVTVITRGTDDDVQVQLSKFRWDEVDHKANTRGTGKVMIPVRTQGEMKIVVTGPEPKPYQLIVWAGTEYEPPLPSIVKRSRSATHGGLSRLLLWSGGVGAGLVLAAAAFVVVKRRRT